MSYFLAINEIEQKLLQLDNASYETIEEANQSLKKYDKLKDEIIFVIKSALYASGNTNSGKQQLFTKAVTILANHIGSADDIEKYGNIMESFYKKGDITAEQLKVFYKNLNTGRWE